MPRASGAVEDQDGIGDFTPDIALGLAESRVMQAEFWESLAGFEVEVVRDVVAFRWRRLGDR
jgi:hypothetical protein